MTIWPDQAPKRKAQMAESVCTWGVKTNAQMATRGFIKRVPRSINARLVSEKALMNERGTEKKSIAGVKDCGAICVSITYREKRKKVELAFGVAELAACLRARDERTGGQK